MPLLIFARLFVIILCVCNIVQLLAEPGMSTDKMLSFSCTLSNLIFICTDSRRSSPQLQFNEPLSDSILRKQIQILNWKMILNKALALHRIRKGMRSKSPKSPIPATAFRRSHSMDNPSAKSTLRNGFTRWHSWNDTMDIPDFHGMDCRNNNNHSPQHTSCTKHTPV